MAIDLVLSQRVAVLFKLPQLEVFVQENDAVDLFCSALLAKQSSFHLGIFFSEGFVKRPECING